MRKTLALFWLIATLLPFAHIVYFIIYMTSMWGIEAQDFQQQREQFDVLFRLHIAAMGLIVILMASYIVYLFRTKCVATDKKALWAVVLFMGSFFAMPIFWFLYVWKPLSAEPAEQAAR
jgi:hypothetical protein